MSFTNKLLLFALGDLLVSLWFYSFLAAFSFPHHLPQILREGGSTKTPCRSEAGGRVDLRLSFEPCPALCPKICLPSNHGQLRDRLPLRGYQERERVRSLVLGM